MSIRWLTVIAMTTCLLGGDVRAREEFLPASAPVFDSFGVPFTDLPGPDVSRLPIFYQNLVRNLLQTDPADRPPLALCFAPDTDEETIRIVSQLIYGVGSPLDYRLNSRWSSTATDGPTGGQGDPITITYSFVPDGVNIPDGIGEGAAPNEIYARMNALFGSEAAWKAKFAEVFARWSELCGVTYVEVEDDGASLFSSSGVLGLRGDVRICMKNLDGSSGVLAYNYYPNTGDMVLDRSEAWALSSSNYRYMRNIVAHEHGHGFGLRHVCPTSHTKLMEPFLSTSFDGPRHDDIRGSQRHYGDAYEDNNTAATATDLGAIDGAFSLSDLSSDDNADTDWYEFTVAANRQVTITLDVIGQTYLEGAQNTDGSCQAGTEINSLDDNNLSVRLYDSSGLVVLAEANSQPAGTDEVIPNTVLPLPGSYYVRILSGTTDAIQLYTLNMTVSAVAPNPLIAVVSPNGGEVWYIGSSQTILWSSSGITGNVSIELNRSFPGGTWEQLFPNTPDDGSEIWTVEGAPSSACRVRVTSISVPTVSDSSDANFTLAVPLPVTDLVIRISGTDVLLDWTATNAVNYLIYSSLTSDGPFSNVVGSSTANSFVEVDGISAAGMRFYQVVAEYNP